jgi:hypothetical protein
LAAWIKHIIALSKPVEGGHSSQTKREHYRAVWKGTGIKPPQLDGPTPPKDMLYLWRWLMDLPHPLSFIELEAWSRLTGVVLGRWEVEALITLDKARADV